MAAIDTYDAVVLGSDVAHPTYAEGLVSLFSNIKPTPPLDSKAE